jgi:hypothetical protein
VLGSDNIFGEKTSQVCGTAAKGYMEDSLMTQSASYPLRLPQSLERADLERFNQLLNRLGGEPPRPGDELPA